MKTKAINVDPDTILTRTVIDCPRCHRDHVMWFYPLSNPIDLYKHWGMCPLINEPVLIQIEDENGNIMTKVPS